MGFFNNLPKDKQHYILLDQLAIPKEMSKRDFNILIKAMADNLMESDFLDIGGGRKVESCEGIIRIRSLAAKNRQKKLYADPEIAERYFNEAEIIKASEKVFTSRFR